MRGQSGPTLSGIKAASRNVTLLHPNPCSPILTRDFLRPTWVHAYPIVIFSASSLYSNTRVAIWNAQPPRKLRLCPCLQPILPSIGQSWYPARRYWRLTRDLGVPGGWSNGALPPTKMRAHLTARAPPRAGRPIAHYNWPLSFVAALCLAS